MHSSNAWTHLIARMHVWLLAFPPVFESEKIVYDSLDLAQGFFYLASEEEAGHSSLSWPVLLERVEHVEAMQQDRGCCDRESGTGATWTTSAYELW